MQFMKFQKTAKNSPSTNSPNLTGTPFTNIYENKKLQTITAEKLKLGQVFCFKNCRNY